MRVLVNGVKLFFDVEGAKLVPDGPIMREKPTLVVLHGGPGGDHSSMKPFFSAFADLAQVVYLDHRGCGRSDHGPRDLWNLAQWGDDVHAFCDALDIERPIVLGVSFGGFVAQSYAVRHPEHPAKLVLSSTSARHRYDRNLAVFERLGGAEIRDTASRWFDAPGPETGLAYVQRCVPYYYQRATPDPEALKRMMRNNRLQLHFSTKEHGVFNFLPALHKIRCPTLVLVGEDDPICPVGDAEDIVAALAPDLVQFERFPGCGHFLRHEDPERTLRVLRDFIAGGAASIT